MNPSNKPSPQDLYAHTVQATIAAFADKTSPVSNGDVTFASRAVSGRAEDLPIAETLRAFASQFDNTPRAVRDAQLRDSAEPRGTR